MLILLSFHSKTPYLRVKRSKEMVVFLFGHACGPSGLLCRFPSPMYAPKSSSMWFSSMQFISSTFQHSFLVPLVLYEWCDMSLFVDFHIFLPLPIDMNVISSCETNHPQTSSLKQQWCIVSPHSVGCMVIPLLASSGLIHMVAGGSFGLEGPG